MGHISTNSFIQIPGYKVYSEHEMQMLNLYFVSEDELNKYGFYKLEVVGRPPCLRELYRLKRYKFELSGSVCLAFPEYALKKDHELYSIIPIKISEYLPVYYDFVVYKATSEDLAELFKLLAQIDNLVASQSSRRKMVTCYSKIFTLLERIACNG